ncbi:hypothetical protein GCM10027598_69880 [Amycolatopsis oliviviridis]|uniref:Uncharacterized protein n=1 Tax=Amycolatopsis oliviviridis TaxID=1471590 RepID=A0ABQ3LYS8_9PSEU|nr:hypothetical protein GCM10017790_60820 [Amycolatopsis oliviviridis]
MLCRAVIPACVRASSDGWAPETAVDSSKAPTATGTEHVTTRLNLLIELSLFCSNTAHSG